MNNLTIIILLIILVIIYNMHKTEGFATPVEPNFRVAARDRCPSGYVYSGLTDQPGKCCPTSEPKYDYGKRTCVK